MSDFMKLSIIVPMRNEAAHLDWTCAPDERRRTARQVLASGQPVLLVGTDCPALDAAQLRRAAAALLQHDACLIPAHDGGYVLLGLRRFDATLFSDIAWSTASVARVTQARMQQLRWSVQVFAPLHDIDEPADLQHLPSRWLQTVSALVPEVS